MTTRRLFLRTCWLPVACWIAGLLAVRGYDGWGAWAAAPLLLPALLLSVLGALLGLVLLAVAARRDHRLDAPVALATLLSGAVLLYYTVLNLSK